jgi:hypothetical protein
MSFAVVVVMMMLLLHSTKKKQNNYFNIIEHLICQSETRRKKNKVKY